MTFTGCLFAFMLALITFYINHRIHKMINIKIIINSLFDIYGTPTAFIDYNIEEASRRLLDEIIAIEKLNDDNFYVNIELKKLKKLRLIYFHYLEIADPAKAIKDINFKKLNRSFIIFAFLDLELHYEIT